MLDEEYKRFCVNNRFIDLTEMETQILAFLIENKHRRVTTRAIAKVVYGTTPFTIGIQYSIYGRMKDLRKKLEKYVEIDCKRDKGYIIRYKGEK